jgi:hypothetical protein
VLLVLLLLAVAVALSHQNSHCVLQTLSGSSSLCCTHCTGVECVSQQLLELLLCTASQSKYHIVFHLLHLSQVTHNRSLDGVLDELHSARMTEAGSTDLLAGAESDYSDSERHAADAVLPGARRGDDGSRKVRVTRHCESPFDILSSACSRLHMLTRRFLLCTLSCKVITQQCSL